MPKLKLLPLLSLLFAFSLYPSCSEIEPNHACGLTGVEEIIDEILRHELIPRSGCNQQYDDYFDKDSFSAIFSPRAILPFDTVPCYTALYMHDMTIGVFTERQCVAVEMGVLDSMAIDQHFPPQSINRARIYLGDSKMVLDEPLDCAKLDFTRMGGRLLCSGEPCDRKLTSPTCWFSDIYVDKSGKKAIVYLVMQGVWQKIMYYFQKIGEKWVLAVREEATSYDKDYE